MPSNSPQCLSMASLLSFLVPPDFDLGDVDFMHNLGKARLTQPEQAIVVLTGYRPGFTSVANPINQGY
jgi:hypothetical protein